MQLNYVNNTATADAMQTECDDTLSKHNPHNNADDVQVNGS